MLCDNCRDRDASVHYQALIDGKETKMNLCADCARELGLYGFSGFSKLNQPQFQDYLSSMLSNLSGEKTVKQGLETRCELCGTSFSDIKRSGKVGCAKCYSTFAPLLLSLIRRIHGSSVHRGKIPESAGSGVRIKREVARLKDEMNQAVAAQEYERAAVIRDKIAGLEKGAD